MKELNTNVSELTTRAVEFDVRANQDIAIKLVQDLEDALDNNEDLLFVCAQEVGHIERAVDVRFSDDNYIFMNPIVKSQGRITLSREFDRINKKEYIVPRFSLIEIIFQDCLGSIKGVKLEDNAAIIMSQALDMLDGVYPSDLGLEIIPEFDEASPEEQSEVIDAYLKTFMNRFSELDESLKNEDEETRKKWDAIKFMMAKSKGEIEEDNSEYLSKRKQKWITKLAKSIKSRENKLKFWNKLKKDKKEK